MDEVRATLQSWNLSQYADVFFEEGYDDLAYLMTLSEEALQRVAESTGMKPGEHTCWATAAKAVLPVTNNVSFVPGHEAFEAHP